MEEVQKCDGYGCDETADLTYGPDPFASEIRGDDTPVWLCASCYHESCMEI